MNAFWFRCLGLWAFALAALAQSAYPAKAITMVVPFPPGGALDIVARQLSQEMAPLLGQPVIVDNRAGAGGTLGSSIVSRAAPDGHTILFGSIATHALAPNVLAKSPYDPNKDFIPITQLTTAPLVLVSSSELPNKTVAELFDRARRNPGKLNFASTGNGTAVHIAGELFKSAGQLNVTHVPYKGGAEAITALLTKEVDFMIANVELVLPNIRAGKFRPLAVTGATRLSTLPDVPTMAEAGLPAVLITTWFGLFAPPGTPVEITARLQKDARQALRAITERIAENGDVAVGSTQAEFTTFVRNENQKWAKVIRDAGIKIE